MTAKLRSTTLRRPNTTSPSVTRHESERWSWGWETRKCTPPRDPPERERGERSAEAGGLAQGPWERKFIGGAWRPHRVIGAWLARLDGAPRLLRRRRLARGSGLAPPASLGLLFLRRGRPLALGLGRRLGAGALLRLARLRRLDGLAPLALLVLLLGGLHQLEIGGLA